MMQNGLALQAGTSHDLGQNFGKAFNVQFQSKEGKLEYVWQTSWGVSTRLIGGLIMSHSDDKGLVLPPKLAPIKTVLVPIYRKDDERAAVLEAAAAHRQRSWRQSGRSRRTVARREVLPLGAARCAGGSGTRAARSGLRQYRAETARYRSEGSRRADRAWRTSAGDARRRCRRDLYNAAKQRLKAEYRAGQLLAEVEEILQDVTAEKGGGKFVMAHVKDDPVCDARMKEFKATVRYIPLVDEFDGPGKCIVTGETVDRRVVIAKAY